MQTQTFNIALPVDLVARMDLVAADEYRNRSELIREAMRVYLEDKFEWNDIYEFGQKAAKKVRVKSEEDINRIVQEYRHGKKKS
jgi:metal-responsive CopG/Arc/MetJ family transcriptional regulator